MVIRIDAVNNTAKITNLTKRYNQGAHQSMHRYLLTVTSSSIMFFFFKDSAYCVLSVW